MSNMGLQGVTGGYKGLQRVTDGYKGFQRVTRGYKLLQGVTRGHKGLHGVTRGLQGVARGYKGLQQVTRDYRGLQRFLNGHKTRIPIETFHCTSSWKSKSKSSLGKQVPFSTVLLYCEMVGLQDCQGSCSEAVFFLSFLSSLGVFKYVVEGSFQLFVYVYLCILCCL